jgi:hypothetical protein
MTVFARSRESVNECGGRVPLRYGGRAFARCPLAGGKLSVNERGAAPIGGIGTATATIDWGESKLPRAELAFGDS